MKKRKWLIAGSLAGAAGAALAGLGLHLSNRIMYMAIKDAKSIVDREVSQKRLILNEYDSLPKEEVWVQSPNGYNIKTIFITPNSSNKYLIFCHGVTENKVNSIKYMNLFLAKGFNAVIYDHRRHGESGGKTTSFGFYEKLDLKAVVDALIERAGDDIILGIHGESMGAATTLLYAGTVEDRADFYIADCPFSDFREQLAYMIQKDRELLGTSRLAISLADFFIKLRDGYTIQSVSPKAAVMNIEKPVLFIHSKNDGFIPAHMTETLYELKKGAKKLFIAENGDHAQSLVENEEEYSRYVDEFLEENGL